MFLIHFWLIIDTSSIAFQSQYAVRSFLLPVN